MKKVIVVGATSGIGRELAILYAQSGCKVGVTGRRAELLGSLQAGYPEQIITAAFDITNRQHALEELKSLTKQLGGLDLLIISSGTAKLNPSLDAGIEKYVAEVNVAGFTTVATWAFDYFRRQGAGQLAGITSIAGLRGGRHNPAYNASKAYQINYLEGLRQKAVSLRLPITITDIRPGFVDTPMAAGDGLFWVAPVPKAAKQIYNAVEHKLSTAYITSRWRLIAVLMKLIPVVHL